MANCDDADEAQQRSAISRAYYAALHSVAITFPKRDGDYRKEGESSHVEIIGRSERFAANPGPGRSDAVFVAKLMPRLKRTRNEADYRLDMNFEKRQVFEAIEMARTVMQRCESVLDCQRRHEERPDS